MSANEAPHSFRKNLSTKPKGVSAMKVRPLHDYVILKRVEEKETVRGGIIIPDSAKEKPQEGEVIAVGTGKRLENGTLIPIEVKEGDRVLFGKYSGTEIKLDGEDFLMVRESEILGVLASNATAAKKK
jgi:chaperonin GroES